MTYAALIVEIQQEAQVESNTDWATTILAIINEEKIELASLQNEQSLHISRLEILAASQDGTTKLVTLPADFLKIDRINYKSGTSEWDLPARGGLVPPIPFVGKPKAYELQCGGVTPYKLRLLPSVAMSTDSIFLSYYQKPTATTNTADTIFPDSWIPELKRKSIERVMVYHVNEAKDRAMMFMQLGSKSEAAQNNDNEANLESEKAYDSPRSS